MANNNKKYVSLTRLSNFLDNIKARYALIGHKHTTKDITDYVVDSELNPNSSNPVQNKVIDAEFDAISTGMQALEQAIDGKSDSGHNHDSRYYTETEIDSKLSNKANATHSHAISEVTNLQSSLDAKVPTSRTINSKPLSANITLSASDVGAAPTSHTHDDYYVKTEVDTKLSGKSDTNHNHDTKYEAKNTVSTHNTNTTAHADIRDLITGLTTRLNTLANSDDTTLDQMSEIVAYIKNNKSIIDGVTTNKVNVADIVNNLTTNVTNKPLSAAQGVVIQKLINDLQAELDSHKHTVSEISDLTATATELNYMDGVTSNVQAQLDSKADSATLIGRAGEGNGSEIFNDYTNNTAAGRQAHAEGYGTTASGMRAHAEGQSTTASAQATHAEGYNSQATATAAHAEGYYTEATGKYSHAEGYMSKAQEQYAHAEGCSNTASGEASHAEGYSTWADGNNSHTEGRYTTASGEDSHAEGFYTHATSDKQHVQGKYNIIDRDANDVPLNTYAHIVGNGTSNTKRSNAHTLDWDGNGWFAGNVYVGGTSQDDVLASKLISEADQRWNLLYDSGEISAIANSISNIDVSGYTNIQVLVRCYNDGDSINSRAGSAIFTCANGKTYQFPVWSSMFSKSINTVYTMATFNLVDGWLVCPYASRLIGDATTFDDEGGTAGNLALTGSGMMKCTSQLSTLTISSLDQNANYYFGMGSRVMVWGWNA